MTTKAPPPALRHDTRAEIAKVLGIPLCDVCSARHPPIVPGEMPLMIPSDDKEEALRRIRAHALHEVRTSPGQELTVEQIMTRLGIFNPDESPSENELTSRARIEEIWLAESRKIIIDAMAADKHPLPLSPESEEGLKQMAHDLVHGGPGYEGLLDMIDRLTRKHESVALFVFHRDIAPLIRSCAAKYRPS